MKSTTKKLIRSLVAYVLFGSSLEASFELGYASDAVVQKHIVQLEARCGLHLVSRDEYGKRMAVLNEVGRDLLAVGGG